MKYNIKTISSGDKIEIYYYKNYVIKTGIDIKKKTEIIKEILNWIKKKWQTIKTGKVI